jgi:hypothetical protein
MDVPGVAETFGDEVALLGALQLRWHTRLAGHVERRLMDQPTDLESAVLRGWREAAAELAGVRAILDACVEQPSSPAMRDMLGTANRKDWALMAAMAGQASPGDARAAAVGRELERRARAAYRPRTASAPRQDRAGRPAGRRRSDTRPNLIGRLLQHLPA